MIAIGDPKLATLVLQALKKHEDYRAVSDIVHRNSSGTRYLVGGKVYRTIIEMVYGYDCGAQQADWDFFCTGSVVSKYRIWTPAGWLKSGKEYQNSKLHSLCFKKQPPPATKLSKYKKIESAKIDIIGLKDIVRTQAPGPYSDVGVYQTWALKEYFSIAPLDIQAIAIGAGKHLYGPKGIAAIERRVVGINNKKGALPELEIIPYMRDKAKSLGFSMGDETTKYPCDCFGKDTQMLWNKGCQQKDIHV